MTFLDKDYELPASPSSYTRLEKGDTKLRILSDAVTGYEYWNTDGKPVRSKDFPTETPGIRVTNGEQDRIKHFWAMAVWNYKVKQVQVWQVSQKTLQEALLNLVQDEDWGDPKNYDVKVNKTGEKLETKYNLNPSPKTALGQDITEAYKAKPVDLSALFTGGDPFGGESNDESDDNPMSKTPF